ncbi:hypothetical protein MNBD_PLANCTO02-1269 [hydrothermal vent metagenome]|uniref:Leucine-rich repeat domain-containing protein n=1 Tax=hydrothermal vent metagenome TaxID=652676 RepID=A0A3B1DIZ6_9ZZZZ
MKKTILLFWFHFLICQTTLFAQSAIDMAWCLSDENNGFETRNGRVVRVNLARIGKSKENKSFYKLKKMEQLCLSLQVFSSFETDRFAKVFPHLQEVQIRRFHEDAQSVSPSDYFKLLSLARLQKLTIERLQIDNNKINTRLGAKSRLKSLDVSVILKGRLLPVLEHLQLESLRLQYLQSGRTVNTDDLDLINKQKNLKTLSFVGHSIVEVKKNKINIEKLKSLRQLATLSLYNISFDPSQLMMLPKLKVLKIRRCHLTSSSFEKLFQHPSLEKVEVIECSHKDLGITSPLKPVKSRLKLIKLSLIPVTDLKYFANSGCELHLTLGMNIATRAVEGFFPLPGDYYLRKLTEDDLKSIKKCPTITKFKFSGLITETTKSIVIGLAKLPALMSLEINFVSLDKSAYLPKGKKNKSNLRRIVLLTNPRLSPILVNEMLSSDTESLSIRCSSESSSSEIALWKNTDFKSVPKLRSLYLEDFFITEKNFYLPVELLPPSLKLLSLQFSSIEIDRLAGLLSRCKNLEQLKILNGFFEKKPGFSQLNKLKTIKRIELLGCNLKADVVKKLKVESLRIGGIEMFSW